MKHNCKGITTSVGYSFAFAALCSLAVSPGVAAAVEGDSQEGSKKSEEPIVSDQATNAPVPSEKSETVYVFANPDGSTKNVEVSTTLKNPDGAAEIADSSELTGIENTESDNTYTGSGKNMVWDAAGDNVYYTGDSTKQAPVAIKVSYFLDGKKVAPELLAGASGHVKIRFDYENNATVKANVRGKEETLYVPFTFITAVLFDNENFKNAEVTNGKMIDDGDRAIVAGYAMPGLKKSLGSIVDDFDIPDYFEIEADVTDFEMKSSLTIATAGMLSDVDTSDLDTKKLEDASSGLTDAMGQIIDGASSLEDGLKKLADGAKSASVATGKLAAGADDLAKGNKSLAEGLETMKDSTSALPGGIQQLATGATTLSEGLDVAVKGTQQLATGVDGKLAPGVKKIDKGAADLAEGAGGLYAGIAQKLVPGISAAKDGAVQVADGLDSDKLNKLKQVLTAASGELNGDQSTIDSLKANAESAKNGLAVLDTADLTENQKDAVKNAKTALDAVSASSLTTQYVNEAAGALEQADLSALSAGAHQVADGLGTILAQMGDETNPQTIVGGAYALSTGAKELAAGTGELSNGVDDLSKGLSKINDEKEGLPAAAVGSKLLAQNLEELNKKIPDMMGAIKKITNGADKLADGSSTLAKGADKIDDGLGDLADGTKSAASGSGKLADGLQTFNDEGIGEITDLIDNDLLPFTDRLDALTKAGEEYDNFAGITKGTKGAVKFIIQTDPIEKSDD